MIGGGEIIGAFLDEGAIDEFVISIVPTFIGEGIPLLAPWQREVTLRLHSAKTFPDGVCRCTTMSSRAGRRGESQFTNPSRRIVPQSGQ